MAALNNPDMGRDIEADEFDDTAAPDDAYRKFYCAILGIAFRDLESELLGKRFRGIFTKHTPPASSSFFRCDSGQFRAICQGAGFDPEYVYKKYLAYCENPKGINDINRTYSRKRKVWAESWEWFPDEEPTHYFNVPTPQEETEG